MRDRERVYFQQNGMRERERERERERLSTNIAAII
jgi:hypothetical protein